jgi:hypothetical protein
LIEVGWGDCGFVVLGQSRNPPFHGSDNLRIDEQGDLLISGAGGELRQRKPSIFQEVAGQRRAVKGRYVLLGKETVGMEVGIATMAVVGCVAGGR